MLPVPKIQLYKGYDLEDLIDEANTELQYSHAVSVTSTQVEIALDTEENEVYILLVGVIYPSN